MDRKKNKKRTEWIVHLTRTGQKMQFKIAVWEQILDFAEKNGWESEDVTPVWSKEDANKFAHVLEANFLEVVSLLNADDLELANVCIDSRKGELESLIEFCRTDGFYMGRMRKPIHQE